MQDSILSGEIHYIHAETDKLEGTWQRVLGPQAHAFQLTVLHQGCLDTFCWSERTTFTVHAMRCRHTGAYGAAQRLRRAWAHVKVLI